MPMTTDRQEPVRADEQPAAANGSTGATQVGQVIAGLERLTRRLPAARTRRIKPYRPNRPAPPREHIAALVAALGDTSHPLHASAVDELAEIGPPAVPAICEALGPNQPWLTAYRAAEAAGRIGDGRAAGPLIQALRHPNSNVRWSAVRALTQVGDVRAALELRRVANSDQGRTSWGEPVAGAAQSALEQLGQRSVWGQSLELIKTAVTCVLMILALTLAFGVVATLRDELDRFGRVIPGQTQIPQFTLPTVAPSAERAPAASGLQPTLAVPTAEAATSEPVLDITNPITATVLQVGNVRPFPGTNNQPLSQLNAGDEVVVLGQNDNGQWLLVRLADESATGIPNPDGSATGWINRALVSSLEEEAPVVTPVPTPTPSQ